MFLCRMYSIFLFEYVLSRENLLLSLMTLRLYQLFGSRHVFVHLPQFVHLLQFVMFLSAYVWAGAPERRYEKFGYKV
jgi:hypothetical protein